MTFTKYVVATTFALAVAITAYHYGRNSAGTDYAYEQGCGRHPNCNWYDKMFLQPKNERTASLASGCARLVGQAGTTFQLAGN